MKKKLLSLLLALAMLLTLLPQAALSASAANYSGSCGDNLTWSFDSKTGTLTIEGEGDMWDFWDFKGDSVSGNHAPWGNFYTRITALSLPEGLTSVGDCAFSNCFGLTELTLPGTLTRIGWWGFGGCTGLTEVTLPESVEYLSNYAFNFNDSLRKITFLNSLCYIEYDALWSPIVTVYGYTPSSAKTFARNNELPFVSLGEISPEGVCGDDLTWRFDTPNGHLTIEGEGDMWDFTGFRGDGYYSATTAPWRDCFSDITAISLPEGLSSIGAVAFTGCWRLPGVEIPAGVTHIGDYAFGACEALNGLVLPEELRDIGECAFSFCASLTEAVIPASVLSVGDLAFSACDALESITFLNPNCSLGEDCLTDNGKLTVYGYSGSTAEAYAEQNMLPFVPLDPGSGFADVKPSAYYYEAMLWALENGITAGTSPVTFGPKDDCTRAQVVTFLWIAAGRPEPDLSENPFEDVSESKYYYQPVLWAFQNGITSGADPTHFNPKGVCTRAQVMTFLWNAIGKPEPDSIENPFEDVKPGKYYCKPVLWALENDITAGVDETHFGPGVTCTRAQVVTFLYKTFCNP